MLRSIWKDDVAHCIFRLNRSEFLKDETSVLAYREIYNAINNSVKNKNIYSVINSILFATFEVILLIQAKKISLSNFSTERNILYSNTFSAAFCLSSHLL